MLNRDDFKQCIKGLLSTKNEILRRNYVDLFNPEVLDEDDLAAIEDFIRQEGIKVVDKFEGEYYSPVSMDEIRWGEKTAGKRSREKGASDDLFEYIDSVVEHNEEDASPKAADIKDEASIDNAETKKKIAFTKDDIKDFYENYQENYTDRLAIVRYMGMTSEQIVALYQEGYKEVSTALWFKHRKQIFSLAKKAKRSFYGANVTVEDLVNVGYLGMMEAAQHYDEAKEVLFYKYAEFYIKDEMHELIAKTGYSVSFTKGQFDTLIRVHYAAKENPGASPEVIMDVVNAKHKKNLSLKQTMEYIRADEDFLKVERLDRPVSNDDGEDEIDFESIAMVSSDSLDDRVCEDEMQMAIERYIVELSEMEREVTRATIEGYRKITPAKLAKKYKTTESFIKLLGRSQVLKLIDYLGL